jgi:hypothetical protein
MFHGAMQCTVLTIAIPNQSSTRISILDANIRAAGFIVTSAITIRAAISVIMGGIAVLLDAEIAGRAFEVAWAVRVFAAFGVRYSRNTKPWFVDTCVIKACTIITDTIFVFAAVEILCCRVAWKVNALLWVQIASQKSEISAFRILAAFDSILRRRVAWKILALLGVHIAYPKSIIISAFRILTAADSILRRRVAWKVKALVWGLIALPKSDVVSAVEIFAAVDVLPVHIACAFAKNRVRAGKQIWEAGGIDDAWVRKHPTANPNPVHATYQILVRRLERSSFSA